MWLANGESVQSIKLLLMCNARLAHRRPKVRVVMRLRLGCAHVVNQRVQNVGDVFQCGHVEHGKLFRVLGAVGAQQRQAVREEFPTCTAGFHACYNINLNQISTVIWREYFDSPV